MKKNYWLWGALGLATVAGVWLLLKPRREIIQVSRADEGPLHLEITITGTPAAQVIRATHGAHDLTYGVTSYSRMYLTIVGTLKNIGNVPSPRLRPVITQVYGGSATFIPTTVDVSKKYPEIPTIPPGQSGTFTVQTPTLPDAYRNLYGVFPPQGLAYTNLKIIPATDSDTDANVALVAPYQALLANVGDAVSINAYSGLSLNTNSPTITGL